MKRGREENGGGGQRLTNPRMILRPLSSPHVFQSKEELKKALTDVLHTGDFGRVSMFDTSQITDFTLLFYNSRDAPNEFFAGIRDWDTSRVESMERCFFRCEHFNQPLRWDTSRVDNLTCCFEGCSSFNQPLAWNTRRVLTTLGCFVGCSRFNQTCNWDLRAAENLVAMFRWCTAFNNGGAPIVLDLPNAQLLTHMFQDCMHLSVPVTLRHLGRVENLAGLIEGCTSLRPSDLHLEGLPPHMMNDEDNEDEDVMDI